MKTIPSILFLFSNLLLIAQDAVATPSSGCGTARYDPINDHYIQTSWDGRQVRLSMPKRYSTRRPTPMVIAFHDRGSTPEQMMMWTMISNQRVNEEAIVLYPTPANGKWSSDATAKGPPTSLEEDVKHINELVDFLEKSACIDTSKIFVVGQGTGGGLAHLLACHRQMSRRIAAFMAVSGAFYTDDLKESPWHTCDMGRRPIPFLEVHGNNDEKWGYRPAEIEGTTGPKPQGVASWLSAWAKRNDCGSKNGEPQVTQFSNGTLITSLTNGRLSEGVEHAGGAVRVAYACPAKAKEDEMRNYKDLTLLHYSLKYEKYGWPRWNLTEEKEINVNGRKVVPPGDRFFDTTVLMFQWFVTHTLPAEAEIKRQNKEMGIEYEKYVPVIKTEETQEGGKKDEL